MMPEFRESSEKLEFHGAGKLEVLMRRSRKVGVFSAQPLPTQRRFLVAPGSRSVAFSDGPLLRVRTLGGSSYSVPHYAGGDYRFSADGRQLFLVRRPNSQDLVERLDLATGKRVEIGRCPRVRWLELHRGGVAAHISDRDSLFENKSPADAEKIVVWRDGRRIVDLRAVSVRRFGSAESSSRLAWIEGGMLLSHDSRAKGAKPKLVRPVHGRITNSETSLNGRWFVWVSSVDGVWVYDHKTKTVKRLLAETGVHTIWFSLDSRHLLLANRTSLWWIRGKRHFRYQPKRKIVGARFDKQETAAVVTTHGGIYHWRPGGSWTELVPKPSGWQLLGGQRYAGGVVVWSAKSEFKRKPPRVKAKSKLSLR